LLANTIIDFILPKAFKPALNLRQKLNPKCQKNTILKFKKSEVKAKES